ncbi:hypothetical protein [Brachybacterium tyrofermentans]|uniref:hypothetical protein n=1 Tax=Brachybacterium tyrofermentans TaxID=47848 RepID=UPI001868E0BD|nr:hypothetical protein [Brachybacterium tyrofermentans]
MAPNMGRGITAPANDENIKTGAAEMQKVASTTAFAIDDLESSINSDLAGKASTGYVDAGLAGATSYTSTVESASLARDDVLAADIAGMEGMTYVGAWEAGQTYRVNDVVTHGGDSWARLTAGDTGEPGVSAADWGLVARQGAGGGFGDLVETAVVGLYDTVAPSSDAYDSGWRDITSLIPVPVTSGKLYLARTGSTVWLDFYNLLVTDVPSATWHSWGVTIPDGFRTARNWSYVPLAPTLSSRSSANTFVNQSQALGPVRLAANGSLVIYSAKDGAGAVQPIQGLVSWMTQESTPSMPPGKPA